MVDDRLLKYVQDALVRGYDDKVILDHLVKSGFSYFDVQAALTTAKMAPGFKESIEAEIAGKTTIEVEVEGLNFFKKIYYILFYPKKFFNNVSKDKGFSKPLFYYSILSFFSTIFAGIIYYVSEYDGYGQLDFFRTIGVVSFSLLLSLFLIFLTSGLLYLFVRLFKGQNFFEDSFKAIVYASTPAIILSFIPILGVIGFLWSLILEIYGLSLSHKLTVLRIIFILSFFTFSIVILFYVVVLVFRNWVFF